MSRFFGYVLGFFALLATPAMAAEVVAEGRGPTFAHAVQDALRQAVAQAAGVEVHAVTQVSGMEWVRDDIVTHAQGYVTRYAILSERENPRGTHAVSVRADVNAGRIRDHAGALAILMKLSGHPRVAVQGLDDGLESVSPVLPRFSLLTDTVSGLFREDFRFDVVVPSFRIPNKTRGEALAALQGHADYALLVRAEQPGPGRARLSMEAVRLADGVTVSRRGEEVFLSRRLFRAGEPGRDRAVVDAVLAQVFPLGVEVAQDMVDALQDEGLPGGGVRYRVSFEGLPEEVAAGLGEALSALPGFVRLRLDARSEDFLEFSCWSGLTNEALDREVRKLLDDREVPYRYRVEDRILKYRAFSPVFE